MPRAGSAAAVGRVYSHSGGRVAAIQVHRTSRLLLLLVDTSSMRLYFKREWRGRPEGGEVASRERGVRAEVRGASIYLLLFYSTTQRGFLDAPILTRRHPPPRLRS